jgi:cytochrome c
MRSAVSLCCLVACLIVSALAVENQPVSKQDKAKALVEKALSHVAQVGTEKAFADFNNPKGGFVDGEFYVFVIDFAGTTLSHGGNPKLIGQKQIDLTDAEGKLFTKEFIETVKTKGEGWVDYKWSNPVSKKVQEKAAFVKQVKGKDIFAGCGFYK